MESRGTDGPLLPLSPALSEEEAALNVAQNGQRKERAGRRSLVELGILFSLIFGFVGGSYYFSRLPFNAGQWKSSVHQNDTRARMAADMVQRGKVKGLNHFQVIALLGKADVYGVQGWDMGYDLGSYYKMDRRMLVIKFDKRKRVADYGVQSFGAID